MPVLRSWELELDADLVLRGQGADPAAIRRRSGALVAIAEEALAQARPLLSPAVAFVERSVSCLRHERLELEGDGALTGALVGQHLGGAERVAALVCTIGAELEQRATRVMAEDPSLGLALDGCGSAAVEALANAACRQFEAEAQGAAWQTTIPLSPGMIGWPVEVGQPQVFALVDTEGIGVRLSPSGMMSPRKSVSFVLGMGRGVSQGGRACDYCHLRSSCRYQDHYA